MTTPDHLSPDNRARDAEPAIAPLLAHIQEEFAAEYRIELTSRSRAARTGTGMLSLAMALAAAGERDEARALIQEAHDLAATTYVWPMGFAMAYARLDDREHALEWLEHSYDDRVDWMCLMTREPAFHALRPDRRFQALARSIGPDDGQVASG